MPSPEQERMDALTNAIVRLLKTQEDANRRLARLEQAMGLRSPAPAPSPVTAEPLPPKIEASPPSVESAPRALETRVGLTWLNRVGVFTLVLGIAFFFKYAVDNQWIGETGRVVLGVLAGIAVVAIADRMWLAGNRIYAQGISAVGIGILYLSFFAAFGLYHLLGQGITLAALVFCSVLAGALALRYGSQSMAALALLAGYVAPVLLDTGRARPWFLLSYLLVLGLAARGLALVRSWGRLMYLAFPATVFIFLAGFNFAFAPGRRPVATLFALLYYALFASSGSRLIFMGAQLAAALGMAEIWPRSLEHYAVLSFAVSFGGLLVADRRGWPLAVWATYISFLLAYAAWCSDWRGSAAEAVLAVSMPAFLLFASWNPWRVLIRRLAARQVDLVLAAANAAAFFGVTYGQLEKTYRGYLGRFAVAMAALHSGIGLWLWMGQPSDSRDTRPVALYTGLAFGFLVLAPPVQFSGYRVTLVWALEAAALAWIGARTGSKLQVHAAMALFGMVLIRLTSLDAWIYKSPFSYVAFWNARFLTFVLVASCLWAAAYWIRPEQSALLAYIGGHFTMLGILGLEVTDMVVRHTRSENLASVQSAATSILMAAYALLLVSIGVFSRSMVNRVCGLGLIALVVLKLYLYDVWFLRRIYQFTAFAGLGALLLLISYLYSRYRVSIENWWRERGAPGPA